MKVKILVCYHKKAPVIRSDILEPIHVGRSVADDVTKNELADMIGDDIGDNISLKNQIYCELTGLYWAWKNPCILGNPSHIGFFHYRRLFCFKTEFISGNLAFDNVTPDTFEKFGWRSGCIIPVCGEYDVILPELRDLHPKYTIYEYYARAHYEKDILAVIEIIRGKYPALASYAEIILKNCSKSYYYNVFVMRRDLFDQYAFWLFDILFELEKRIDISSYDSSQRRLFGFIAERLMTVFMLFLKSQNRFLKIKNLPVVTGTCDSVPSNCKEARPKLKIRLKKKLLNVFPSFYAISELRKRGFDKEHYLGRIENRFKLPIDPVVHYVYSGSKKGINPNGWFDTKFYLNFSYDITRPKINPLVHYLQVGIWEGKLPNRELAVKLANEYKAIRKCVS